MMNLELHIGDIVLVTQNYKKFLDPSIELLKDRYAIVMSKEPDVASDRIMVVFLTSQTKYATNPDYVELLGLSINEQKSYCDNFVYTINKSRVSRIVDSLSKENLIKVINNIDNHFSYNNSNDYHLSKINFSTIDKFDSIIFNLLRTRIEYDKCMRSNQEKLIEVMPKLDFIGDENKAKIISDLKSIVESNCKEIQSRIEKLIVNNDFVKSYYDNQKQDTKAKAKVIKETEIKKDKKESSESYKLKSTKYNGSIDKNNNEIAFFSNGEPVLYKDIVELYVNQGKTISQTAKIVGCKYDTLHHYIRRHKIEQKGE